MKLTVGPLPAAVYWRRRGVVLGGLVVLVLISTSFCSTAGKSQSLQTTGTTASASPRPSTTQTLFVPTGEEPTATPSPSPAPPPPGPAAPPASGPCTDAEVSVAASPASTTVKQGVPLKITLKIKNISTRTCARDLGADVQELYIQQGAGKIWSSDTCDQLHGTVVRQLPPGIENAFYVNWDGKATAAGCDKRTWPAPGAYQVVGRLGGKVSEPVNLQIQL